MFDWVLNTLLNDQNEREWSVYNEKKGLDETECMLQAGFEFSYPHKKTFSNKVLVLNFLFYFPCCFVDTINGNFDGKGSKLNLVSLSFVATVIISRATQYQHTRTAE